MSHYISIPEETYVQTPAEFDSGNCQQIKDALEIIIQVV
jgi:hypothetical protein